MAGKTNTSATFFAQKKLLGKAHTSNLKTDGEELIGSNIQAATSLTFGEEIPVSASLNLYTIQSASNGAPGTIEYIPFILTALTGTTYDANNVNPDGGSGQDSGESSQSSGPHTYKFVFPSDYVSNSSNSRKGDGFFNNNRIVHETLGKVQLVPPFFTQQAPNPYIVKIYKDNGSGGVGDEIPLLDNIDWNVDYFNGILFLQDYDASKIPAHARAFAYVGKMADEVITSGGGGGSGDAGAQYLVLSNTGSLSNERAFTAGTGITTADAGANGNFTVGINDSVVATLSGSTFSGKVTVNNDLVVSGTIFANEFHTTVVSSSIIHKSGSTKFGDTSDDTHHFTGSATFSHGISGSLTRLLDGESYLVAGANVTITSASNGQVTVAASSTPPAGSDTEIQFNNGGVFGASSAFTFTGTEVNLHAASPALNIRRTNNNQNSDIDFKGTGGVVGARLRFSGSQSNDLVLTTFTGTALKERMRIRSNLPDIAVEVTGALRTTLGLSGSLTRLSDGTSFLKSDGAINIVSESNGSITINTPNYVFNEYVGQADGVNTLFSLAKAPTAAGNVSVYVNGLLQMPATSITGAPFQDYSITGSNIYFTTGSAPFSGSLLMANYTTNT